MPLFAGADSAGGPEACLGNSARGGKYAVATFFQTVIS